MTEDRQRFTVEWHRGPTVETSAVLARSLADAGSAALMTAGLQRAAWSWPEPGVLVGRTSPSRFFIVRPAS